MRFGEFELDLSTRELSTNGAKQTLAPQPFQVLELLIKHRGQLVTRDDLIHHLWPSDTFVDYEQGLKKAINRLRDALNDSAEQPRFIENLPRQGYRFIAKVEVDGGDHNLGQTAEPIVLTPKLVSHRPDTTATSRWQWPPARTLWVSGLLVACVAIALVFVFPAYRVKRWRPSSPEIIPLVTLPGVKTTPSISPDGTEIAFAYQAEGSNETDIYIKGMEDDRVTRLTSSSGESLWPSWSPDGQKIVYNRRIWTGPEKYERTIMLMTRLGGNQHPLRAAAMGVRGRVSWTPDGNTLVFADIPNGERPGIFSMSTDGSNVRRLTTSPAESDLDPAVSSDGSTVVFVRTASILISDLYTVPISGGEPRRLTNLATGIDHPVWTPDGRSIIFASTFHSGVGGDDLYSVPAKGGTPELLPFAGFEAMLPSISAKGDKLVVLHRPPAHSSIWRMGVNPVGTPTKLIASTVQDGNPAYSPDGKRVAFTSEREGTSAIWKCNADGSDAVRLTTLHALGGAPVFSPDGSRVAFDDRTSGRSHIYAVGADGGTVETLTAGNFDDTKPAWSGDGKSIYFASNRTGRYEIWRKELRSGEAVQITRNGGVLPQVSPDGKDLYFNHLDKYPQGFPDAGLWRVPVAGGEEEFVLDGPQWEWAVTKSGVYFIDGADPNRTLKFFDFATRQTRELHHVDGFASGPNFAVLPDETSVLFVQPGPMKTEILLVKGLRW